MYDHPANAYPRQKALVRLVATIEPTVARIKAADAKVLAHITVYNDTLATAANPAAMITKASNTTRDENENRPAYSWSRSSSDVI
jgi:hypothetical protein